MQGFLNLLTATALARRKRTQPQLVAILDDDDPGHFRFDSDALYYRGEEIDADALRAARRSFVAYGSCSFSEPVHDLSELRLLGDAG